MAAFDTLPSGPFPYCLDVIALSETRFVAIPEETSFADNAVFIFMYYVTTNQWHRIQIGRHEGSFHRFIDAVYDKAHELLHIFGRDPQVDNYEHMNMYTFNLRTSTFCEPPEVDLGQKNILIGDHLHIFEQGELSGKWGCHHSVINTVSGERIKEPDSIDPEMHELDDEAVLFVELRNSIIVRGREKSKDDDGESAGNVITCEYSLSHGNKQWNRWKWVPNPYRKYQSAPTVCTNDGRYMFAFGGWFDEEEWVCKSETILVHDLKRKQCMESAMLCPRENFRAIVMGNKERDEKLTFGFVRRSFKDPTYRNSQSLPNYLVELIGKSISTEYIHIIQRDGSRHYDKCRHWKVNVDDILQSVTQTGH